MLVFQGVDLGASALLAVLPYARRKVIAYAATI